MNGRNLRRALIAFWLMTLAYVGLLLWVDHDRGLLSGFDRLHSIFPVLILLSLASFLIRFARWHWLLTRAGATLRLERDLIAYLSGFALTATPGKAGELLRIRYLQPMGAAPELVLSAFVYERAFDLVVVLCLAGIAGSNFGVFPVALTFVVMVLAMVFCLARYPHLLLPISGYLERRHMRRLARFVAVFVQGFTHTAIWLTPKDVLVSLLTGFVAWGLTAYAFVMLLNQLDLDVPVLLAFSLYPMAMLVGAASTLPGGIGSTEAALVMQLAVLGVSLTNGTVAAIGIRLGTLWFATLLGLLSMLVLEFFMKPQEINPIHRS